MGFCWYQLTDEQSQKHYSPSVMLRQAKYRTPTEAVSKIVATKLPSTLAFEPLQITWKNVE